MLGKYENIDRRIKESNLEPVDVLLGTLDEETYLERCLDSVYREIPVNKLIVIDGGSKDKTIAILKKYPRVEIHIRPDIRTTGKCCEFLFSYATTSWVAIIEGHIELPEAWYDEVLKYKGRYDFFGCKRIVHYEFYRVDPTSLDINQRPMGAPWLARLDCFNNYHVDDDYMWRHTDRLLRQVAEKNGYRFGKVATTYHYHHTTDKPMYESDAEKRGSRLVFEEPTLEILDKANREKTLEISRKAIVKYLDPEFIYPRDDDGVLLDLTKLDMEWVKKTNVKWYNVLAEYRRKNYIKVKLARTMGSIDTLTATIVLIRTITKAFKDYMKHITNH